VRNSGTSGASTSAMDFFSLAVAIAVVIGSPPKPSDMSGAELPTHVSCSLPMIFLLIMSKPQKVKKMRALRPHRERLGQNQAGVCHVQPPLGADDGQFAASWGLGVKVGDDSRARVCGGHVGTFLSRPVLPGNSNSAVRVLRSWWVNHEETTKKPTTTVQLAGQPTSARRDDRNAITPDRFLHLSTRVSTLRPVMSTESRRRRAAAGKT